MVVFLPDDSPPKAAPSRLKVYGGRVATVGITGLKGVSTLAEGVFAPIVGYAAFDHASTMLGFVDHSEVPKDGSKSLGLFTHDNDFTVAWQVGGDDPAGHPFMKTAMVVETVSQGAFATQMTAGAAKGVKNGAKMVTTAVNALRAAPAVLPTTAAGTAAAAALPAVEAAAPGTARVFLNMALSESVGAVSTFGMAIAQTWRGYVTENADLMGAGMALGAGGAAGGATGCAVGMVVGAAPVAGVVTAPAALVTEPVATGVGCAGGVVIGGTVAGLSYAFNDKVHAEFQREAQAIIDVKRYRRWTEKAIGDALPDFNDPKQGWKPYLDTDKDGTVTVDEVRNKLAAAGVYNPMTPITTWKAMDVVDTNGRPGHDTDVTAADIKSLVRSRVVDPAKARAR